MASCLHGTLQVLRSAAAWAHSPAAGIALHRWPTNRLALARFLQRGGALSTSGADDEVVKFLCPLTITDENLKKGIDVVEQAIKEVCAKESPIPEEVDFFDDSQLVNA